MSSDKEILKRSVDVLIEKAADASALAKDQRKTADEQHAAAHKLEDLSEELAQGAADLKESIATAEK